MPIFIGRSPVFSRPIAFQRVPENPIEFTRKATHTVFAL